MLFCDFNIISGMVGKTPWEQTLHDMVVECAQDVMNAYAIPHIYHWMVFKSVPEPENKDEVLEKAKQRWVTVLKLVEKVSKGCGSKKFIVGNEVNIYECTCVCTVFDMSNVYFYVMFDQ